MGSSAARRLGMWYSLLSTELVKKGLLEKWNSSLKP
jgi:hypothetical protein